MQHIRPIMVVKKCRDQEGYYFAHDTPAKLADWKRDSDTNVTIAVASDQAPEVVVNDNRNGHR